MTPPWFRVYARSVAALVFFAGCIAPGGSAFEPSATTKALRRLGSIEAEYRACLRSAPREYCLPEMRKKL